MAWIELNVFDIDQEHKNDSVSQDFVVGSRFKRDFFSMGSESSTYYQGGKLKDKLLKHYAKVDDRLTLVLQLLAQTSRFLNVSCPKSLFLISFSCVNLLKF